MNSDIVVSHLDIVPDEVAYDFARDLRSIGVDVEIESRESGPQAGLEWLLPTAVVVFITQRYVGTLLQEAAKDHYPVIKNALKRLIGRTTGPDRKIQVRAIAIPNTKIESTDPVVLSVYAELRTGRHAKFVFEHSLPPGSIDAVVEALLAQLLEHQRADPNDVLGKAAAARPSRWEPIVLRFIEGRGTWEVWSPHGSPDDTADPGAA